jgi:hypothetical protein
MRNDAVSPRGRIWRSLAGLVTRTNIEPVTLSDTGWSVSSPMLLTVTVTITGATFAEVSVEAIAWYVALIILSPLRVRGSSFGRGTSLSFLPLSLSLYERPPVIALVYIPIPRISKSLSRIHAIQTQMFGIRPRRVFLGSRQYLCCSCDCSAEYTRAKDDNDSDQNAVGFRV